MQAVLVLLVTSQRELFFSRNVCFSTHMFSEVGKEEERKYSVDYSHLVGVHWQVAQRLLLKDISKVSLYKVEPFSASR